MVKYYTVQELMEITKPKTMAQIALEKTMAPFKNGGGKPTKAPAVKKMKKGGSVKPKGRKKKH